MSVAALLNTPYTHAMDAREKLIAHIKDVGVRRASPSSPILTESGLKVPILFDMRAVVSDPQSLQTIAELFWEQFDTTPEFDICGIETGGITLSAALALEGLRRGKQSHHLYVRKSRKKNGALQVVEGVARGVPLILVDDMSTSGRSLERSITILKAEGFSVAGVFVLFTQGSRAGFDFLTSQHISFCTLFTREDIGMNAASPPPQKMNDSFVRLWKLSLPNPSRHLVIPKSDPLVEDDSIYVGSDAGIFYALSCHDGSIRWQHRVGYIPFGKGIFSSPASGWGHVFFGAYDGNVYALDAKNGKQKWIYRDADWVGSSPAVAYDLGLIFIGTEFGLWSKKGGIVALDAQTGAEKWAVRSMPEYTHGSPLYVSREKAVYIGSNDGTLFAFNAKNGSVLWTYKTKGAIKETGCYDPITRLVFFGSHDGRLYALNARTGALQWSYDTGEAIYAAPCIYKDTVIIPSLNKNVYSLSCNDGTLNWTHVTQGRIFSSPVVRSDEVWIGGNDGILRVLSATSGILRAYAQLSERIVTAVTFTVNETIIVTTQANEVYHLASK